MTTLDKIQGFLFGVALGDALGAPHEFRTSIPVSEYTGVLQYPPLIPSRFQGNRYESVGQWSDDTEMTLALANSLIRRGGYDRSDVILSYEAWANSHPPGMGKNTRRLLAGVKTVQGYERRYQQALSEDLAQVESNGSLMRSSPLSVLLDLTNPDVTPILQDVDLTNPNPVNRNASLIYVGAIRMFLDGFPLEEVLENINDTLESLEVPASITEAVTQALNGEARDVKANKGWVVHGLYSSIAGLKSYQEFTREGVEEPFAQTLNRIILQGGDTDTNAAITGGLLGSYVGYSGLYNEPTIYTNLEILINADTTQGDFPRPDMYHPKTIPEVATGLMGIYVHTST